MSASWPYEDDDLVRIATAFDEVLPGSVDLGALAYLKRFLTALDHDPPRIWAAPPSVGDGWLEMGPWEREAWFRRIEELREVIDRVAAGDATKTDRHTVYTHACCATYGDPAYGGNRDGGGWASISFPEPVFPPARTSSEASDAARSGR